MLAFKRRKTCELAQVSTLNIPYMGEPKGMFCMPDGSILLTTQNKIAVYFPSGPLPCTFLAGREFRGFRDGSLTEVAFDKPSGILLRANGDIVIVDTENNALRYIDRNTAKDKSRGRDVVSTLAGSRDSSGFADGLAVDSNEERQSLFNAPSCAVLLECGDIAILDTGNHALRLLSTTSRVSTLAGNGEPGLVDGRGQDARFCFPSGLAFDHMQKRLIVSDSGNHAIRMVCMMGTVTTIAGTGLAGFLDGPCRSALFSYPAQVVVDGAGLIVVADTGNNRIRVVNNPRTSELSVTTLVGGKNVFGPICAQRVDGVATEARFKDPTTLALDRHGRLLVVEKHAPDQIRIVDVGLEPPVYFSDADPHVERMESRGNALMKALDDLSKLRDDMETADVVFVAEGERFPAHRVVISTRCTYLSNMLKFHGAQSEYDLQGISAPAFRVLYNYLYSAEMHLFSGSQGCKTADVLSINSTAVAREVLMTAEKWGLDELYLHFVQEFKRTLTATNCTEALVWSMTKGTVLTRKVARAFFLKNRHEVREHAHTLLMLKDLAPEQMHEMLLAVLLD